MTESPHSLQIHMTKGCVKTRQKSFAEHCSLREMIFRQTDIDFQLIIGKNSDMFTLTELNYFTHRARFFSPEFFTTE